MEKRNGIEYMLGMVFNLIIHSAHIMPLFTYITVAIAIYGFFYGMYNLYKIYTT